MRVSSVAGLATVAGLSLAVCPAQPVRPNETWGLVVSTSGPNIVLDDGQLLRLGPGTRVERADGSAGSPDDVSRGSRLVVRLAGDGTVAEARVYMPRSIQVVYLSNVPPVRGAAYVVSVEGAGAVWRRSLAVLRATYTRPATWTQFRTGIRYDTGDVAGAPAAARFMLKDSFGDVIVDRVVSGGETGELNAGLDAQATDRITLEVAPAGEGELPLEACLWLDPHFALVPPAPTPPPFSARAAEKVAAALTAALGEMEIGRLAIADFAPARGPRDASYLRDLTEDLLVLLGQRYPAAGAYRKQLSPGTPLPDADRKEMEKLQATHVLTGSVNWRPEGTVINAVLVQVDNGALVRSATATD